MDKVLVVDDEEKIRRIIRKYAEFEGYFVEEAADGEEALKMVLQQDFDVIEIGRAHV